jgi:uncharacterized protein (DUF983 family)
MKPRREAASLTSAMWRGFRSKCPNCGTGKLFGRFLKVVDDCLVCGEDFTPQRADDLPAYLVIVVVGHTIVPAVLMVEAYYAPPAWLQLLIWLPATLISALALLQPIKGAIVGLQWQLGMQGFAESKQRRVGNIDSAKRDFQTNGCATTETPLLQPKGRISTMVGK